MQKEYYKLRAKIVIDLTRSHWSRCGRDVVAGLNACPHKMQYNPANYKIKGILFLILLRSNDYFEKNLAYSNFL